MKHVATFASAPTAELAARGQMTLGMTHRQFGEALGTSERTSQRWARSGAHLTVDQLRTLAQLVFPRDAELAGRIAAAASESLESLGLVAPPPPAPAPAPAAVLPPHLVGELLVSAAASALGVAPNAARPAIVAALARASELGLSLEDARKALAAKG
jgi:hypothetical protein